MSGAPGGAPDTLNPERPEREVWGHQPENHCAFGAVGVRRIIFARRCNRWSVSGGARRATRWYDRPTGRVWVGTVRQAYR